MIKNLPPFLVKGLVERLVIGGPRYLLVYCTLPHFRFEVTPVAGQEVTKVYGLVTEPEDDIYISLRQRD